MTPTEQAARAAARKISEEIPSLAYEWPREQMSRFIAAEFTPLLAERDATIAELQAEVANLRVLLLKASLWLDTRSPAGRTVWDEINTLDEEWRK